jgi:Nif-specific regulatory protein
MPDHPRLVALSGPLQGSSFDLSVAELSIGRDESNALCLDDRAVSRWHCIISILDGTFQIRDLESSNRTRVNRIPIDQCLLKDGDEITVGRSRFLFVLDGAAPELPAVDLEDAEVVAGATVLLRQHDALFLRPDSVSKTLPSEDVARSLKVLLNVSAAVSAAPTLESLQHTLLESLAGVVPSSRGVILLRKENGEFEPSVLWERDSGSRGRLSVPQTIVQRVAAEKVSLCLNDVLSQPKAGMAESVVQARINSLVAVPVVVKDEVIGIIYLDSVHPDVRFQEDHLQLLTGIAGMTAMPLRNAVRADRLEQENRVLGDALRGEFQMVGDAPCMREVYRVVRKVAPSNATVMIGGESGTGKELVARAIHYNSPRGSKPFIAINCAALTETLLESEFFGHEKGAFTGASVQKRGKIEEANGGTVFLDEIGEMSLALQAKLLRVLQERQFERVGGTRTIKVDIRVLAATNRNLEDEVRQARFRQDLFYRLNVVTVEMPPLRERVQDIPALARYFLQKHQELAARDITGVSAPALACLMKHDWPGNVRELENAVVRAVVLGNTDEIQPEDLPKVIGGGGHASDPQSRSDVKYHETIRDVKRQLVTRALLQADGNHTAAAELLGLHPNNLHRLLKTLGLKAGRD